MKSPDRGYIRVSRDLFASHPWATAKREYSPWEAYLHLVQLATHTPFTLMTKWGPVELARGEFVLSLRAMADAFGWSLGRTRRWSETGLFAAQFRAQRTTHAGIVYLVVNYEVEQGTGTAKRTAIGTDSDTGFGTDAEQTRHKNKHSTHKQPTGALRGGENAGDEDALPQKHSPWVAEAGDDWKVIHGGLPNYKKLAGLLANAVRTFGWDAIRPKWQRFLRSADARFGPAYFVEHMGNYDEAADAAAVAGTIRPATSVEAEHVWELCKRYGFHHCTRSTIDGELERAKDAGDIDDPEAFKTTLRKLDVQFLREARSDGAAVASIAKRLAA